MKTTAILSTVAPLATAMQTVLEGKLNGFKFQTVSKISDRAPGAAIASFGMPSYIPGNQPVRVFNFGTRYDNSLTSEQRAKQYEVIRNENSSVESILAELGNFQEFLVIPGPALTDTKLALADAKLDIAAAETDEARLEAYKKAYEILSGVLSAA